MIVAGVAEAAVTVVTVGRLKAVTVGRVVKTVTLALSAASGVSVRLSGRRNNGPVSARASVRRVAKAAVEVAASAPQHPRPQRQTPPRKSHRPRWH